VSLLENDDWFLLLMLKAMIPTKVIPATVPKTYKAAPRTFQIPSAGDGFVRKEGNECVWQTDGGFVRLVEGRFVRCVEGRSVTGTFVKCDRSQPSSVT